MDGYLAWLCSEAVRASQSGHCTELDVFLKEIRTLDVKSCEKDPNEMYALALRLHSVKKADFTDHINRRNIATLIVDYVHKAPHHLPALNRFYEKQRVSRAFFMMEHDATWRTVCYAIAFSVAPPFRLVLYALAMESSSSARECKLKCRLRNTRVLEAVFDHIKRQDLGDLHMKDMNLYLLSDVICKSSGAFGTGTIDLVRRAQSSVPSDERSKAFLVIRSALLSWMLPRLILTRTLTEVVDIEIARMLSSILAKKKEASLLRCQMLGTYRRQFP